AAARAVEPLLAARGERLAALPQRERALERLGAGLEARHDLDELVAGLLVAELGDGSRFGCGHRSSGRSAAGEPVLVAPISPSARRTRRAVPAGASPGRRPTPPASARWTTA